jgi:tRNA/rRNA methyltransferase
MTAVTEALTPAVILVEPQLGENIGAVARAMLNCGLSDLRLVKPRDGWPSAAAQANAAGADSVIESARLFERVEDAIGDLRLVYATTARLRDMVKPVMTPEAAASGLHVAGLKGEAAGIMFGRERSGLTNDEVTLADAAVTFPLNPGFTSLNLAQAVLLVGWEWWKCRLGARPDVVLTSESPPARRDELFRLFEHLESELDAVGFFFPPEKRPHTVRNLRNLIERASPSEQEVRTLHGVVRSLSQKRQR